MKIKEKSKILRKAIYIPCKRDTVGVSVYPNSVKSPIKTNQSVSNIPLQHLGPCLNCKFVGTRWSGSCCSRIIYSVGRAARMCERVYLWGPQLWAAVSCNPPWSMARSVMSQLPHWLRGKGSKVKRRAFFFLNNINMRSKGLSFTCCSFSFVSFVGTCICSSVSLWSWAPASDFL